MHYRCILELASLVVSMLSITFALTKLSKAYSVVDVSFIGIRSRVMRTRTSIEKIALVKLRYCYAFVQFMYLAYTLGLGLLW